MSRSGRAGDDDDEGKRKRMERKRERRERERAREEKSLLSTPGASRTSDAKAGWLAGPGKLESKK